MTNDDRQYITGFKHGAGFILGIVKAAARRHPLEAAKQTLNNLHEVLNEGLQQWQTLETESSTSPNSSTPPLSTLGEAAISASIECTTKDTTPKA